MTGAKRIQDGVVRLEYVAGDAAVRFVSMLEKKLKETEKKLNEFRIESSKPSDADMVLTDIVLERAETAGQVSIVAEVLALGSKELLKVAKEITSRGNTVVIIGSDKEGARLIVARSDEDFVKDIDCSKILKEVMPIVEGSGGGKQDYAQGGGSKPQGLSDAVSEAKKLVLKALG
jgi:alanyl-tRNA synthetase